MKLSEFFEATRHHHPDAEIVIAGGMVVAEAIEAGQLYAADHNPRMAKAISIADPDEERSIVVVEL